MKRSAKTTPDDSAKAALRQYLAERGYLPAKGPLRITPAERASGKRHVSRAHDCYLADRRIEMTLPIMPETPNQDHLRGRPTVLAVRASFRSIRSLRRANRAR